MKKYLLVLGYLAGIALSIFVLLLVIPDNIAVDLIYLAVEYQSLLLYGLLALLLAGGGYRAIKHLQTAPAPWSAVKKELLRLFPVLLALYACVAAVAELFPANYGRCDYYTQQLGGGIHEFRGQKYTIHLCGTGGDSNQNNDKIRLRVLSAQGSLLAQRYFVVDWDSNNYLRGIKYFPDHISYSDESRETDSQRTVDMPPSAVDWMRTMLPLFD